MDFRDRTLVLLLVTIAIVAILSILKAKSRGPGSDSSWPFYPKKPLSQPEQVLYFRLLQALPDHIVLAQVQLSRLLGVKTGNNQWSWLNRINRLSADFVVCNKDSTIVAVIELDDASHNKTDRQIADAKKDKALSSGGIRLIRWHMTSMPDVATIHSTLIANSAEKEYRPHAAHALS